MEKQDKIIKHLSRIAWWVTFWSIIGIISIVIFILTMPVGSVFL